MNSVTKFAKTSEKNEGEGRNWLQLPRDVMFLIFTKLGAIGILYSAQSVCSSWRNLSKESDLFQFIDFRNPWHFLDGNVIDAKKLSKEAVDRSNGNLIEISLEDIGTDELLDYIVDKSSNSIKCLRLLFCDQVSITGLIEFVRKVPLLEELELCHSPCSGELIEELGRSCLQLKCFKLSCIAFRFMRVESDEEAFAIAEDMTQLRRLQLFGNKLTNNGLEAILDECTHLEYLDLRRCFNIDLRGDLEKKCVERVKTVRFPNDLCDDFEYEFVE
ncbi:F-box protein skip19 [Thalictrum thalictroides]|uniref:F-box protein skip19 n=1 Tax=Thalictrum thalictroides TaxID=46969 RepID=A0A7J6VAP5_THATH|nr:F-box protein skip19 [Thalictrum thalictroides]